MLTVHGYLARKPDSSGRTELIGGAIVPLGRRERPSAVMRSRLHLTIAQALEEAARGMEALVTPSLALSTVDVPAPDIVITDAPDGTGLVPLDSVKLVIEVADATLGFDLKRKLPMYARNGVAEYWVVDVNARRVIQHWSPAGEDYRERRVAAFGEVLTAATVPGLAVATDGL